MSSWSPGDPFADIMKHMIQQDKRYEPVEMVICGRCTKIFYWNSIRRILDAKNNFVGFRCTNCVTEGNKIV